MNDLEARRFLHDNLYARVFRTKVAELTGIQFESPEEEAVAQALAYRLKTAAAQNRQTRGPVTSRNQQVKMALYAQLDKMAGNVLGDYVSPRDQQIYCVANDPSIAPYLDAVNL